MKFRFSRHFSSLTVSAVGLACAAIAPPSLAAGTASANLSVSAIVNSSCTITAGTVAFGAYDPIVANATTPLDANGTVSTTCTTGSAVTITLGQGGHAGNGATDAVPVRQLGVGGDLLAYNLWSNSGYTTMWGGTKATGVDGIGTGAASTLTVYGRIAPGQVVPVGTYTDTVVATVSF